MHNLNEMQRFCKQHKWQYKETEKVRCEWLGIDTCFRWLECKNKGCDANINFKSLSSERKEEILEKTRLEILKDIFIPEEESKKYIFKL